MNEKNGNEAEVPKLGARLRQGREAMGLTLEEAGRRLHLPHQVVRRIENDDVAALGAPVFVRGYLRSYARLVGLAEAEVDGSLPGIEAPPLIATGAVPMSRRLLERFTRQSLYIVLTGITVVPVIFLALGGHLSQEARLEALDPVPTEIALDPLSSAGNPVDASEQIHQGPPSRQMATDPDRRTMVASLLPTPRTQPALEERAEGPLLGLSFSQRSWVEVHNGHGERLEFGMLPAGAERSYPLHSGLQVSIGNAEGAEVWFNGESLDLSAVRRANVARFRVSSDGRVQPSSGS